jgi:hypothetical protein
MSDPERLLDHGSDLEARLLASAIDEPPPPDLLGRTLGAVLAVPAVPGPADAAAAAKAGAAAHAAGGGILGAIGIGALAGLLTVGGFELLSSRGEPRPASSSASALPSIGGPPEPPAAAPSSPPSAEATAPGAPSAVPAASGARPSTLAAELALLDVARRALGAGDPARARDLLDRYGREIPRGQLGREAALLRGEVEAASGGVWGGGSWGSGREATAAGDPQRSPPIVNDAGKTNP